MSGTQLTVPLQVMCQFMAAGLLARNMTVPLMSTEALADNQATESWELPPGYVVFPEYRLAYKLSTTQVNQSEAILRCARENGRLAVIDSREKVTKIVNKFSNLFWAWVDIHLLHKPDGWITVDGTSRNVLPWANNQPSGSSRCVQLYRQGHGLCRVRCMNREKYLCEIAFPRIQSGTRIEER